ncbi:hypothetical protein Daesc_002098 [Daldinia eschscholtzii]|uniref:HEPN domain-containing protein n=1 Tax=Daldinia eschscholtzii TaxID=292717 RepID=A0AAX6MVZ6_9PEZI
MAKNTFPKFMQHVTLYGNRILDEIDQCMERLRQGHRVDYNQVLQLYHIQAAAEAVLRYCRIGAEFPKPHNFDKLVEMQKKQDCIAATEAESKVSQKKQSCVEAEKEEEKEEGKEKKKEEDQDLKPEQEMETSFYSARHPVLAERQRRRSCSQLDFAPLEMNFSL